MKSRIEEQNGRVINRNVASSRVKKDVELNKDNLETELKQTLSGEEKPAFTIRADENTKHKDVVFVMEIAERNKYNLAIATIQEQ